MRPDQDTHEMLTFGELDMTQGIGDINSDAKGTGARFNGGKPAMELIPLTLIAMSWRQEWEAMFAEAMRDLGKFQETGDTRHLLNLIDAFESPWEDCARVFEYGKRKYAEWNWAKGMPWSVPLACAARHLMAMRKGEENDPESGLPHRGHVMCNVVMLLTFSHSYVEGNDLPIGMVNTI